MRNESKESNSCLVVVCLALFQIVLCDSRHEKIVLGGSCGRPRGSGRWMEVHGRPQCGKCGVNAYWDKEKKSCSKCRGSFTNLKPSTRTTCKDLRPMEPPMFGFDFTNKSTTTTPSSQGWRKTTTAVRVMKKPSSAHQVKTTAAEATTVASRIEIAYTDGENLELTKPKESLSSTGLWLWPVVISIILTASVIAIQRARASCKQLGGKPDCSPSKHTQGFLMPSIKHPGTGNAGDDEV